jgi:DNA-binding SARP family transcriptional activator
MRIKVLGPVEVERDGELLAIGGPQQRRLLALLVAHRGQVVSTDRLVDALWPDERAPEGALASMRTYIARLRSVLPDGWITTTGPGYGLSPNGAALDLAEFDALLDDADQAPPDVAVQRCETALRLWRGPPFGEFTDEWWALPETSRLVERRASAEEQGAAALMVIGHHNRAIPDLKQVVREQPLRERPVRLLMLALDTTGRRAEALRTCRSFRNRLADETGLDPSHELDELEAAMLAGDEVPQFVDRPLRGYTIHRAIGEGAHGRLYEATQPGTDRPVAIKVIRPDVADSTEYVRRFEAEARLVARLEHPHIVPLYDYWREPGGAYLVFRLLAGGTARDSVISGGPWSLERTCRLVEEIGGALISAHGVGVSHNDVKATNVLLDSDGAAYLTDFGIAVVGEDAWSGDDSQRRDVRDLAWMVWELLTGERRPGVPARATNGHSPAGSVPSLIGRAETVPDGLDAVLSRGGAVEGGFASVAEFLLAWRAATGGAVGVRSRSAERLATDSARRLAARQLTLATTAGINPYRGLRPFEEADTLVFHGRDEVVGQLLAAVEFRPFVAVVGASGSGKSSVVRAGLTPVLGENGTVMVTMTPGDDPLSAMREALSEVATTSDANESGVPSGALADVARRLGRLVVVIDQFEECWTRAAPERRLAFLDIVTSAIADESADIRFVVTVRADLLDRPLEDPALGPYLSAGAYVLSPLTATELGDAIVLPASQVGVSFDEGVVADLIAETVTHQGSLPLLQFTLTELYDRRVDGVIGPGALEAIGGLAGAIGRRAEELYRSLGDAATADARDLFARLVTPGHDSPDTRRRARFGELSPGMLAVAARYVEARLLVTDRDPSTREPTVEVAHEALLTRWSRLKGWIDEDRRWLAQLQHLSSAARAWDASDRRDADV